MVNTGFPSKDCETCRQRRVKCDLGRPYCRRCEKIGRPCLGYRDLTNPQLQFRVQTPNTFLERGNRTQKLPVVPQTQQGHVATSQTSNPSNSSSNNRLGNHRTGETTLPGSIYAAQSPLVKVSESWDLHIMPLIVYNFSFPSPLGGRIHASLECFPNLLSVATPDSTLWLVSQAVGYAYLANQTGSREPTTMHRKLYCSAIRELQLVLCDPSRRNQDAIVLAVWLACLYELMVGDPPDDSGGGARNWGVHCSALGQLLRLRGAEQFRTKTGRQLFQLAYQYIQIQSLTSISDPAPEAKEWFKKIQPRMGSDGLYYLQSFFYGDEVARACREAKSSFTTAASIHEKLAAIEQLASAHDHLAVYLDASVEEPPLVSSEPSQPPTVAQIMRSQRGGLRIQNHINACLLLMQSITLELIFKMPDTSEIPTVAAQRTEILQAELFKQSQDRADRILNTLPSLLPNEAAVPPGWADSLRIMWPLRMIIRSPAFGIEAKQPAINALRRIAYEMGLLQAVGSFYGVDSSFK